MRTFGLLMDLSLGVLLTLHVQVHKLYITASNHCRSMSLCKRHKDI